MTRVGMALIATLLGCGSSPVCVAKAAGGDFCLGDPSISEGQVLQVTLFDVDVCRFPCAARIAPVCQVARDGGMIQLQIVGQVCQPVVECSVACKPASVRCAISGLPLGQYQVGSPGQPSQPLEVVVDGGAITVCASP